MPLSHRVRALREHHRALEKAFPVKTRRAQAIVKAVANRAGLTKDVASHVLRHPFATTALQKGSGLTTVRKILGHDRLQTTAVSLNFTNVHIQTGRLGARFWSNATRTPVHGGDVPPGFEVPLAELFRRAR